MGESSFREDNRMWRNNSREEVGWRLSLIIKKKSFFSRWWLIDDAKFIDMIHLRTHLLLSGLKLTSSRNKFHFLKTKETKCLEIKTQFDSEMKTVHAWKIIDRRRHVFFFFAWDFQILKEKRLWFTGWFNVSAFSIETITSWKTVWKSQHTQCNQRDESSLTKRAWFSTEILERHEVSTSTETTTRQTMNWKHEDNTSSVSQLQTE